MRPLYPAAAFSTLFLLNATSSNPLWDESSVSLLISFQCEVSVKKAVLMVVFFSLDDAKSCQMLRRAIGCRKSPPTQDVQSQRNGDRSTFV